MAEVYTSERGLKDMIGGLLLLMRPHHWVKNAFVLAPLVFSGLFYDPAAVQKAVIAMLLFCLVSSITYTFNDLRDREDDRRHPVKSRTRPIANGRVTSGQAMGLLGFLGALYLVSFVYVRDVALVTGVYLVVNLAYTFWLKRVPVIDLFVLSFGFVLRVYAGGVALGVPVSHWMFVTTFCLALYLASIKRRQELVHAGDDSRAVLQAYSVALVDRYAEMSATGALVFYSLFVMSSRPELVVTIPLVLFGLFRYWFIVERKGGGESPTRALLTDWQMLVTLLVWLVVSVIAMRSAAGLS